MRGWCKWESRRRSETKAKVENWSMKCEGTLENKVHIWNNNFPPNTTHVAGFPYFLMLNWISEYVWCVSLYLNICCWKSRGFVQPNIYSTWKTVTLPYYTIVVSFMFWITVHIYIYMVVTQILLLFFVLFSRRKRWDTESWKSGPNNVPCDQYIILSKFLMIWSWKIIDFFNLIIYRWKYKIHY